MHTTRKLTDNRRVDKTTKCKLGVKKANAVGRIKKYSVGHKETTTFNTLIHAI